MKTSNETFHTNTIQRLLKLLTPEELTQEHIYQFFILLIRELITSDSPKIQEVFAKLSSETTSVEDYELLADLIESGEVETDDETRVLVVSRLRGMRAGV